MSDNPYELDRDYWDELPPDARQWIERYAKATKYGNFQILQELCEEAPSDQFEQIKAEVIYERDFYKRNQYNVTRERKPRYSEWDYGWHHTKSAEAKKEVMFDYYGGDTGTFSTLNDGRRSRRKRK